MSILKPDDLFRQADKLIAPPAAGPPLQVDLRRAISSAYYGLFHFVLAALADEFVGTSQRSTPRYALVYRSVEHRRFRDICIEARRQAASSRFAPYVPRTDAWGSMQEFARTAVELQEKRHLADYNPEPRFKTSDARLAIDTARVAVQQFQSAGQECQKAFLTLLLCPPR
jgi:hypothetical protein